MPINVSAGRPAQPAIGPTDITALVHDRAKEAGIVHDLKEIPKELLAGVVSSSLQILGNRIFSLDGNTASGPKIVDFLQERGLSPEEIALVIYFLATTPTTPGTDNLVHISLSKIEKMAKDPNRINSFFAKCKQCQSKRNLAPLFRPQPNPLDYAHAMVRHQGTRVLETAAQGNPSQPNLKIHDLAQFFKLAAGILDLPPQTAEKGALQGKLLAQGAA